MTIAAWFWLNLSFLERIPLKSHNDLAQIFFIYAARVGNRSKY